MVIRDNRPRTEIAKLIAAIRKHGPRITHVTHVLPDGSRVEIELESAIEHDNDAKDPLKNSITP